MAGMTVAAQTISIQLTGTSFLVAGWNPPRTVPVNGWPSVFAVYAGTGNVPPLVGEYAVENGVLTFHPRFPFAAGMRYRAVFHPPNGPPIEKIFAGPARDMTPRARVERVYPSADVLPSNQLRLYIYFSTPMSRGEADARIHVVDAGGKTLEGIFLPGEELWDPNNQRLTMTLDPGRIKRGLTSNQKMGPPISPGKLYTLVIDRGWPDARGVPLVEGFRKTFRGAAADRQPPDPKQWRVIPPRAATVDPLMVDFPESMNYPLLERMLQVAGPKGKIAGSISIENHETRWRFSPRDPWMAGPYQLIVEAAIEDLAGNHIGQPFDIDVFEHVTEHIATTTMSLPFTVPSR